MSKLFFCLAFIASTVLAQASPQEEMGFQIAAFDSKGWVAQYAGETELDGVAVNATFEVKAGGISIPQWYSQSGGLHFGLITEEQPKPLYRLALTAAHNPGIRAVYSLEPRSVSLDGVLTLAYLSSSEDERGFRFLVVITDEGELKVSYTRKTASSEASEGRFSMTPVPHIL